MVADRQVTGEDAGADLGAVLAGPDHQHLGDRDGVDRTVAGTQRCSGWHRLQVRLDPADALAGWTATAADRGLDARVHTHPGVGHFFTDPCSVDHDEHACDSAWSRVRAFLASTASYG